MPETTPLIKAALNLRGGAGFDVYLFALCYSSLNTIIVFVESFQIDTVFYLEQINQRIIVSLIFLTVYFLGVLLFFYISYRIAIRKIKKLSTDI